MDMTPFFKMMVEKEASDLFFSVGAPPSIKIQGEISAINDQILSSQDVNELAFSIMNDKQNKEFEANLELNLALPVPGMGRFRINVFRQRGEVALVMRYIKGEVPSFNELNLPPVLQSIVMEMRGLVLVVGSTGSGKSTTLSSMIDYRNEHYNGHILTIEDPIEYLYKHKKSIVDQREVGIDTHSYENALVNAMREAPDVILIGEIRDCFAMKQAIAYAETGHLCLSTLHANNANQAIERILNFFPDEAKKQVLIDLSLNLRAIISLRLIPGVDHRRVPALEILMSSPYISDLIEKGKIDEIKEVMGRSREQGMQTFDQALFDLYKTGKISQENAIRYADSKNNVGLQIRLNQDNSQDLKVNWDMVQEEPGHFKRPN